MNAEKLKQLIEQERANEQQALIVFGAAQGRRQAYENVLNELNMQAAVEKEKQAARAGEGQAA
jgi:hypothetical protein